MRQTRGEGVLKLHQWNKDDSEQKIWLTEFRIMEYGGWSKWAKHKAFTSLEDRAAELAELDNDKSVLYGYIEYRSKPDAE